MTNYYLWEKEISARLSEALVEAERQRLVRYCCARHPWKTALPLSWLRREPRPAPVCCTQAA